jgi:hypothetical protein
MRKSIFLLFAALACLDLHAAPAEDLLGETRSLIQEWVKTEQLVSLEKRQWTEEKSSLSDILTILTAEQRELNNQISLAQDIASRADEERAELVDQLSSYQEISEILRVRISDYERQLLLLTTALPETLRKELAPRFARLDSSNQASSFSLSERAQTVLNIMSEIERFDMKLTLTTEIINNSQNEPLEVRVLYFGLSRAFYVNDNGTLGGYGVPSETGWQWQSEPELSASISRALDIYETRITPQLIALPMQVVR